MNVDVKSDVEELTETKASICKEEPICKEESIC